MEAFPLISKTKRAMLLHPSCNISQTYGMHHGISMGVSLVVWVSTVEGHLESILMY